MFLLRKTASLGALSLSQICFMSTLFMQSAFVFTYSSDLPQVPEHALSYKERFMDPCSSNVVKCLQLIINIDDLITKYHYYLFLIILQDLCGDPCRSSWTNYYFFLIYLSIEDITALRYAQFQLFRVSFAINTTFIKM